MKDLKSLVLNFIPNDYQREKDMLCELIDNYVKSAKCGRCGDILSDFELVEEENS